MRFCCTCTPSPIRSMMAAGGVGKKPTALPSNLILEWVWRGGVGKSRGRGKDDFKGGCESEGGIGRGRVWKKRGQEVRSAFKLQLLKIETNRSLRLFVWRFLQRMQLSLDSIGKHTS